MLEEFPPFVSRVRKGDLETASAEFDDWEMNLRGVVRKDELKAIACLRAALRVVT